MPDTTTQTTNANKENPAEVKSYKKDFDGNEITTWGKFFAGAFLILLTFLGCLGIIRYWPDRLPAAGDKLAPLYINEPFHVRLACLPDTCCPEYLDSSIKASDTTKTNATDTTAKSDTPTRTIVVDSVRTFKRKNACDELNNIRKRLLHINTLLLILVALGGFVGNMIHIGTSFTTFVGAGKFKRSWLLWYCIKPFTAAALAIGIYFVFRGGFLNMSDGGTGINLYGLMTISLFAGLFTDKATEKLKEVFEVLFRSKEERPDPLTGKFKINSISPLIIDRGKENKMTLSGEKLDTEKLIISIQDDIIPDKDKTVSAGSILFPYTLPDSLKDKSEVMLSVKDDKGKEHYKAVLTIKESGATDNDQETTPDTTENEEGLG